MKLTLLLDGEEQVFKTGNRFPALTFKKSLMVATKLEENFSVDSLDDAVEFIATELFHKQFTAEEFWEGTDASELMEIIRECLMSPANAVQSKLEQGKN